MMPEQLTDLERRVLDFLVDYLRRNTYQPSIREIGRRFNIRSTKTVSELLQSLADKGWIERDPSRSRGVRLLGVTMNPETVTVPHYGPAAITRARAPDDGVLEAFELDRKLAGTSGTFMVAMEGDSLVSDGIRDGDLLVVDPVAAERVEDGDIVVARVDGRRTVRRVWHNSRDSLLHSGHRARSHERVREGAEPVYEGRVTSIVRRLRDPSASAPDAARPNSGKS
jgi:repressor LexA